MIGPLTFGRCCGHRSGVLLPVRAQNYQVHDLHSGERIWTETNCYIDLWIEVARSAVSIPHQQAPVHPQR